MESRLGKYQIENRAYWARPDSDIPAISETMHTSRS